MQIYSYKHEKKNTFKLIGLHSKVTQPKAYTHILLAMIDLKDIYDILPVLNALNVASLQLFYADFSQKNRKIDMQKAQRILQYSCMQCGRMKPLKVAIHKDLESVCKAFPNAIAIDFLESVETFENLTQQERQSIAKNGVIIGCEGGFSQKERNFLHTTQRVYALQTPFILTAHLVSTYIASLCV